MRKQLFKLCMFFVSCMMIFAGGQPEQPPKAAPGTTNRPTGACSICHTEVYETFKDTAHATELGTTPVGNCTDCHSWEGEVQASAKMKNAGVSCTNCHMPAIHGASGTFRTHSPTIDPRKDLERSCKNCHSSEGGASTISDRKLNNLATGYHQESGSK